MKFTAKQSRFIDEYLIDLNATQAAIRAGYSKKTAFSIGPENLKKPLIMDEVNRRAAIIAEKTQDKVASIINNLWSLSKITDPDKYQHRTKAIELLGKYFSMWQDKVDITSEGKRAAINITFEGISTDDPRVADIGES